MHRNIEKEKQRAEQAARDVKAKAKAMAVALQTIGKFVIKKKVGEGNKIFGRWGLCGVVQRNDQQCM